MGFKILDQDLGNKMKRRVLIVGGPNTFKTTSIIRTFPKPLHLLSFPGEKGSGVIPTNDPGIKAYIWEEDAVDESKPAPLRPGLAAQINEIERTTAEIILGRHGEIKTFAGDGLHKLASLYWNREFDRLCELFQQQIDSGKTDRDGQPFIEGLKLRAYGNENYGACRDLMRYVTKVCQSNCDTVVFTCWEGVEAEDKELTGTNTRHIFADLPGKLARKVVGEFGVVVYAEVGPIGPDGKAIGTWQIRKKGKVWGVGVKTEESIALNLPDTVPMDWSKLYPLITGEVKPAPRVGVPVAKPVAAPVKPLTPAK